MLRHRSFWVILFLTAVVWILATMSDSKSYSLHVRVEWEGLDTSRYVVTYADTLLPITVTSNGFYAISRYFAVRHRPYTIAVQADTAIKVDSYLFDDLTRQFAFQGIEQITSPVETLRIQLTERQRRGFVPQLHDVQFLFTEQFGLSGAPIIEPDTVWLYGDTESLNKIQQVVTAPCTISHISDSGYYRIPLAPTWRKYRDLRSSHDSIRILLPVDRFVERTFSVPVAFRSPDASHKARLYPNHVDVTLWVPVRDYDSITADMLQAVVDYDPAITQTELPVLISTFPTATRVKQVTPSALQYVILVNSEIVK